LFGFGRAVTAATSSLSRNFCENTMQVGHMCGETFVIGATPETTARAAARKMSEEHVGALVVVGHDGRVIGLVTDRDLAVRVMAVGRDPETTRLGEIMSKPAKTVSAQTGVHEAARLMRESRVRRLAVVDDHGRAVGVISLDDLLTASAGTLASLAGIAGDARAAARGG
jgi:signal-transduction protein with cAMP-binding, CBS, and nucleotidyltransferase domain